MREGMHDCSGSPHCPRRLTLLTMVVGLRSNAMGSGGAACCCLPMLMPTIEEARAAACLPDQLCCLVFGERQVNHGHLLHGKVRHSWERGDVLQSCGCSVVCRYPDDSKVDGRGDHPPCTMDHAGENAGSEEGTQGRYLCHSFGKFRK